MRHWYLFKKLAVLFLSFVVGLWLGRRLQRNGAIPLSDRSFHPGLTIERFADLSELLVTKIEVSDVLVTAIEGRTGGVHVVLLIKGDVSLGVDLSAARFARVDDDRRTALLTLPPPVLSRPRLDHVLTRIVLVEKQGLWVFSPRTRPYGAVVDRGMTEAQGLVRSAGTTKEADVRARAHAEAVLRAFFSSLGWTVRIQWSKPYEGS